MTWYQNREATTQSVWWMQYLILAFFWVSEKPHTTLKNAISLHFCPYIFRNTTCLVADLRSLTLTSVLFSQKLPIEHQNTNKNKVPVLLWKKSLKWYCSRLSSPVIYTDNFVKTWISSKHICAYSGFLNARKSFLLIIGYFCKCDALMSN